MHGRRVISSNGAFPLLLLALAALAGCESHGRCAGPCNDITPGAIPQPCGTFACEWINAETARAKQDYFVIFQYEWSADPTKLSPFGQQHLARLAQQVDRVPYPIVVEPSPDEAVNAARQAEIVSTLEDYHVSIGPERVVLGQSEAEGLYGQEAPGIAETMLYSRGGGGGVGAGYGGTQPGTFGPSQGGYYGTTQMPIGIGIGGY